MFNEQKAFALVGNRSDSAGGVVFLLGNREIPLVKGGKFYALDSET